MAAIKETAERFFDDCETGRGWDACKRHCHPGATFSAQAGALAGVATLEGYADWMKGLFTPVPPTGKRVQADYVYVMQFDGDRIRHMTKIWNDVASLQQLGWM